MTAQADQAAPRRRRWLRILNISTMTLAVAFTVYRFAIHWRAKLRIAKVHHQGYPVSPLELDKWYPPLASNENASSIFTQAFLHYAHWESNQLVRLPLIGKPPLPEHNAPLPPETEALIAEYLAANREALVLLHQAATIPVARFPIDFCKAKFGQLMLPHLTPLRTGARLLCLEAITHAETGDAAAAADSVRSGIGLANSFATEPNLISQLVRGACYHYACVGMERTLNRVALSGNDLTALMNALPHDDGAQGMRLSLIVERARALDWFIRLGPNLGDFLMVTSGEPIDWGTGYRVPGYYLFLVYYTIGFTDLDLVSYANLMDNYVRISERPAEERFRAIPPVQARIQLLPRRHWVSRMLTDDLGLALIKNLRLVAEIRTARAALEVERLRLTTGHLPETLAELSPAMTKTVLLDPFDGQPLRYKKLAKGYVVYSVGEDGKDDGGDEKKDITFTVER
jgi:hypothetical protein